MRLSVPGSVLLVGEYAILEEGGLGVAMAVEKRVRVSIEPAQSLTIQCTWPGVSFSWPGEMPQAGPLLSSIVQAVQDWLQGRAPSAHMPCVALSVESSALFRPDGRKAGLGSSAATAAGLTFALLHAAGMRGALLSDAALALSVKAHRTAQGGAGSGYDVVCSLRGGFGLFHGGSVPSWTPCRLAWEPEILLFQGPAPVRTPAAVNAYDGWKRAKPAAARSFLESSNAAVRAFVSARSPQEALRCLAACRQVGCDLGDAIGVPARIDVPAGLDAAWCKALGAGNELGACLGPGHAEAVRAPFSRAASSVEGIVWEP